MTPSNTLPKSCAIKKRGCVAWCILYFDLIFASRIAAAQEGAAWWSEGWNSINSILKTEWLNECVRGTTALYVSHIQHPVLALLKVELATMYVALVAASGIG